MPEKLKKIPEFETEAAERAFWESHDSTEYVAWSTARQVIFPNIKPTTTPISIRLPTFLLEELKSVANSRDVPYQSLIKLWLHEKLREEKGRYGV